MVGMAEHSRGSYGNAMVRKPTLHRIYIPPTYVIGNRGYKMSFTIIAGQRNSSGD